MGNTFCSIIVYISINTVYTEQEAERVSLVLYSYVRYIVILLFLFFCFYFILDISVYFLYLLPEESLPRLRLTVL